MNALRTLNFRGSIRAIFQLDIYIKIRMRQLEYSKKTTFVVFYKTFYSLKMLTSFRDHKPHCQAKHTTVTEKNKKIGM